MYSYFQSIKKDTSKNLQYTTSPTPSPTPSPTYQKDTIENLNLDNIGSIQMFTNVTNPFNQSSIFFQVYNKNIEGYWNNNIIIFDNSFSGLYVDKNSYVSIKNYDFELAGSFIIHNNGTIYFKKPVYYHNPDFMHPWEHIAWADPYWDRLRWRQNHHHHTGKTDNIINISYKNSSKNKSLNIEH